MNLLLGKYLQNPQNVQFFSQNGAKTSSTIRGNKRSVSSIFKHEGKQNGCVPPTVYGSTFQADPRTLLWSANWRGVEEPFKRKLSNGLKKYKATPSFDNVALIKWFILNLTSGQLHIFIKWCSHQHMTSAEAARLWFAVGWVTQPLLRGSTQPSWVNTTQFNTPQKGQSPPK